jgi:hypothetical protein
MVEETVEKITFYSLLNTYFLESFEIFVVMTLIRFITNKPMDIYVLIKYSLTIGIIVMIIGFYNKDLKKNIKGGMIGIMSAKMVTFE